VFSAQRCGSGKRRACRALLLLLSLAGAANIALTSLATAAEPARIVRDEHVVWNTKSLNVSEARDIVATSPLLAPFVDLVIDRAGFHSISPAFLVVLASTSDSLNAPPDSPQRERDRVDAFIAATAQMFHLGRSVEATQRPITAAVAQSLNRKSAGFDALARTFVAGDESQRVKRLTDAYVARFGEPALTSTKSAEVEPFAAPAQFLRLPWLVGQTGWSFNGVHSNSGGCPDPICNAPRSSIDFSRGWPSWGTSTTNAPVHASHGGTVDVFSSCNLRVVNANGWATNYYHLSNIVVADNSTVVVGQKIADYADSLAQATCQGGSSTGPHVHFTLLQNGVQVALDQSEMSGWLVNASGVIRDYDANTARMYLSRSGVNACAYNNICNPTSWAMHTLPTGMASSKLCDLDLDGNGALNPAIDGVLLLRYLLGMRGANLVANLSLAGAPRADASAIVAYAATRSYDLNYDGAVNLFKDGLYAIRSAQGVAANDIASSTGSLASGLLTSSSAISAYVMSCR
jgi:LasA protease